MNDSSAIPPSSTPEPSASTNGGSIARTPLVNDAPRPRLSVPYARQVPRIAASLDDPAWASAATIDRLPLSLAPPHPDTVPVPTQVRLLWSSQWLYIRFICEGEDIYAPFTGRDQPHHKGDVVEVFLDPAGDGRQWIEIQVSPDNQILDKLFLMTADPVSGPDLVLTREADRDLWAFLEWDLTELRTAAGRFGADASGRPKGWLVDMAIPAATLMRRLGKQQLEPRTMRINLLRYERPADGADATGQRRRLVAMNWAPVRHGNPHRSPQAMGYIELIPPPDAVK